MGDEDLRGPADEWLMGIVGQRVVGMVVGMVIAERELVVSRGPVAPDGVFDIGSITKVFTALLLADMARRGQVDLEDPLSRSLPGCVPTPPRDGREITLLDLATHTSGLPPLPRNLRARAILHGADPYRGYDVDRLLRALAATRIRQPPGSSYRYSNFGFAVLGHALAAVAGVPYERLVVDRVCLPLGLNETMPQLSPALVARREKGHGGSGRAVPDWDVAAFGPAGSLRSTMPDMVRFLRVNLDPAPAPLAAALDDAQVPRRRISAEEEIGLAWHIRRHRGAAVTWHNGGTGGFGSFVAMIRERGTGVAVLYNSSPSPAVDEAAFRLLCHISGMG